jgi:hypothetical protein
MISITENKRIKLVLEAETNGQYLLEPVSIRNLNIIIDIQAELLKNFIANKLSPGSTMAMKETLGLMQQALSLLVIRPVTAQVKIRPPDTNNPIKIDELDQERKMELLTEMTYEELTQLFFTTSDEKWSEIESHHQNCRIAAKNNVLAPSLLAQIHKLDFFSLVATQARALEKQQAPL